MRLFLCLLVALCVACGDDEESGITWRGDKVLAEDTEIAAGETLTIEAGTTVSFAPKVNLSIAGEIIARGTEQEPIRFVQQEEGRRWGSVEVTGSSAPAQFDAIDDYASGSIFEHVIFEGARRALHLDGASPLIQQNIFRANETEGGVDPIGAPAVLAMSVSQASSVSSTLGWPASSSLLKTL